MHAASAQPDRPPSAEPAGGGHAAASLRRMEEASLEERRRRYCSTTMGERLECAFELGELADELHAGLRPSR